MKLGEVPVRVIALSSQVDITLDLQHDQHFGRCRIQ